MPKDSSDASVGEQEVTQPSEPSEKQRAPQQLRQLEIIQKPCLEYANTTIVEDEVNKPEIYKDVSQNSVWQKVMEEEIIALEQNQTWELVSRSRDVKSIFCKWIYKIKYTPDGSIVRYKTQTVDPRFSQQYGLDYDETFSPVAKIIIVQVPSVLAVNKD